MKTQVIKIRNIPALPPILKTVRVKPTFLLVAILILGTVFMLQRTYMMVIGLATVLLTLLAMAFLPDRMLAQFTIDYLILYNTREKSECTIVYWEDIVSWQYEKGRRWDTLRIALTNGETVSCDMYSKRSILNYMQIYAPNKEQKLSGSGRSEA